MSNNTASASRTIVFTPKGTAGSRGPALRGPREWSTLFDGAQLYAGAEGDPFVDVVIHNGYYYYCKNTHTKNVFSEPGGKYGDSFWQLGDKLDLVATKILLSEYAVIKNLGAEAIEMKDADGNVIFEAKDGNVTCQTGTFNNVNVQTGQVAGFTISDKALKNGGFDDDAYIVMRNDNKSAFAAIGANILPPSLAPHRAMLKLVNGDTSNLSTLTDFPNYGAIIGAQGVRTNVAMLIDGGCIQGYAMSNKVVKMATTLDRAVSNVICEGASTYTVTLPQMKCYDDGHVVRFKSLCSASVNIKAATCETFNGTAVRSSTPVIIYDRTSYITPGGTISLASTSDAFELVWVRDLQRTVNGTTYYGAWVQYKFPRDW